MGAGHRPFHAPVLRPRAGALELPDVETSVREALAAGWTVVVWNDPINLMSYVVYVFQRVLKMDHQTASRHMLEVHHRGKSVVAKENREKAELFVHQLQAYGLHATLEAA